MVIKSRAIFKKLNMAKIGMQNLIILKTKPVIEHM